MNRAATELGPQASGREMRFRDWVGPAIRSAARLRACARDLGGRLVRPEHWLRLWSGARLLELTILACAGLAVVRRTEGYARLQRGWVRAAAAVRRAWVRAEGFEMEASAGIALVVLAIVIVVHGLLTG